jgi:hypothetical protein
MNPEGNIGIFPEQMHGGQSPGAGRHQARGTNQACLERTEDGLINRVAGTSQNHQR